MIKYEIAKKAFDRGYVAALIAFAYWKDGEQYVGSCGTTLAAAREYRENSTLYCPPTKGDVAAWIIGEDREPF